MDTLAGRLLVATPGIESGPFHRSVVLLLDHDVDGAVGVVLNHPLEAEVRDVLPAWAGVVNAPDCLFQGGPVATDAALAVGVRDGSTAAGVPVPGWRALTRRLGIVDLDGDPPTDGSLVGLRVFAGYAGWAPGQLDAELGEGSWLVAESRDEDLLSPVPERMWRDVLRRQDDELRYLATYPEDPGLN
jgi:putative transcriptional regulator